VGDRLAQGVAAAATALYAGIDRDPELCGPLLDGLLKRQEDARLPTERGVQGQMQRD
jgi:hypothetical protein